MINKAEKYKEEDKKRRVIFFFFSMGLGFFYGGIFL